MSHLLHWHRGKLESRSRFWPTLPSLSLIATLVEIVGEAEDGAQAVEVIERQSLDQAFLDLQMPELDGLGVVRLVKKSRMPLIAFVTASDEYAVKAFDECGRLPFEAD